MNSKQMIILKLGNKIIFQHPISQLNNLQKKNTITNKKPLINNVILKINFDNNNKEIEKKIINEEKLLKKMMNGYFNKEKPNFMNEISKEENQIMNLQKSVEKFELNDNMKFQEMISILNNNNKENIKLNNKNKTNDKKKEILSLISSNKKFFSKKLCLNKNNFDKINQNLVLFMENNNNNRNNINNIKTNESNDNSEQVNNKIKIEKNKTIYRKINKIKEEYIKSFKTFIGNDKLSDRIIISYFDINHPNVKIAAQKYFISKYGLDEITLIYIYQTNPNDKFCHKFKLISEINELFIKAKNEKNINPRLYMKSGKEIKNNSKIKCIGALNLDNNSIIKII
jgi:hypothetical protein